MAASNLQTVSVGDARELAMAFKRGDRKIKFGSFRSPTFEVVSVDTNNNTITVKRVIEES